MYETDKDDNVVVQGDLLTDTEALGDLKDVLPGRARCCCGKVILEAARRMTS